MKRKVYNKTLLLMLLLPAGIILSAVSSNFSYTTEKIYSSNFYRFIGRPLSLLTGIFPFSLGELIIVFLTLFILFNIVRLLIKILGSSKNKKLYIADFLCNAAISVSIVYFVFIIIWGLNYNRLPWAKLANLDVKPASVEELSAVCRDLIERANALRPKVSENSRGVMYLKDGYRGALNRAHYGYDAISGAYPAIAGKYGNPKPVILSSLMSYTGITGVYFPFTGEANVNVAVPDSTIPATICHEMAHQRGFAREDEANYIAYLVCVNHPDADFQYSGVQLALITSMNTLYNHDFDRYKSLSSMYSAGVKRDLAENNEYWVKYEGPVEKVSDRINNAYLKANFQKDGVYSYGRMVDLLIAEYRSKKEK